MHVGILSATFGKSVIAIAKHEKIKRYYKQIGEMGRCIKFEDCTPNHINEMIDRFYNKTVNLSEEILRLADLNWKVLDEFIEQD